MKNKHIRYIALDMDGTILNDDYVLSPAVSETLSACKSLGKKVIIATGRVFASAKKYVAPFGGADGFVCSNGADIYDGAGAVIAQTHMDDALSRRIVTVSRNHDTHFHAFIGDDWYYEREQSYTPFYIGRTGYPGYKVDFDALDRLAFTKGLFLDDHEKLEIIKKRLEEEFGDSVQIMYSAPFMLEVVVNGVSKSLGLGACVAHLGGSLQEVIAFGDAGNDEDMLIAAAVGVAMGDASEELKAKADAVTLSVNEDGVAVYLRDFFGLQGAPPSP